MSFILIYNNIYFEHCVMLSSCVMSHVYCLLFNCFAINYAVILSFDIYLAICQLSSSAVPIGDLFV